MPFNHSASTCIKLLLIICLKLAKVTSKQYLDALSITLFCRMKFFKVIQSVQRKISFESFYSTNERFDEC